jgi:hypothetical protein
MDDVRVSIDVRLEAGSERQALRYAAQHGIDTSCAKWSKNHEDDGGRLYIAFSSASAAMTVSSVLPGIRSSLVSGKT